MYFCFVLEDRKSHPRESVESWDSPQQILTLVRSESEGPWYPQVMIEADRQQLRFFAGKLTGNREPQQLLPAEDAETASPGAFDGSWLSLSFDFRTGEVELRSDLFLFQRWYYVERAGRWYFSNSLLYLHQYLRDIGIEWRAVPYMLSMGYLPGAVTPLCGVSSLRSGECLRVCNGRSTLSRWTRIAVSRHPTDPPGDPDEAARRVLEAMREAVRRELEGYEQVIIPLSGGMDSRFLLACALDILPRDRMTALTFGHPRSDDYRIGTKLARTLGLTSIALPADERPLDEILQDSFATSEGAYWVVPDYPLRPLGEALGQRSVVLSGYIGDFVFGSYELPLDLAESSSTDVLVQRLHETIFYLNPSEIAHYLQIESWDALGLENSLRSATGAGIRERYERWIYENHLMNRTNFALQVHRDRAYYLAPFVQENVLRLAYTLPREGRWNQVTQLRALQLGYPMLYAYPAKRNAGFSMAEGASARVFAVKAWRYALSMLDEQVGRRCGRILYHHPRWNYNHLRELSRPRHRDLIAGCLDELAAVPVFQRKALQNLRNDYLENKPISAELLRGLLTVHRWIQHYRPLP